MTLTVCFYSVKCDIIISYTQSRVRFLFILPTLEIITEISSNNLLFK
jgi:hypothetical protein